MTPYVWRHVRIIPAPVANCFALCHYFTGNPIDLKTKLALGLRLDTDNLTANTVVVVGQLFEDAMVKNDLDAEMTHAKRRKRTT